MNPIRRRRKHGQRPVAHLFQRLPFKRNLATRRAVQPADQVDQGGLAGPDRP